jgi:hypothetical protein
LQIHPDARAFRIKTIPYYSDLCLIYGDPTVEKKGKESNFDAVFDSNMSASQGLKDLVLKFVTVS